MVDCAYDMESMLRFIAISILILFTTAAATPALAQKYDHFEVENNDLVWRYTFDYMGSTDSIRKEVAQMLKSKFFTFNVTRNEVGYMGEIKHYKLNCKQYGRTYYNTPRMYWDGEWTGKFRVEVLDNHYTITIYALYYEKMKQSTDYYRTERPVKGRYIDAVMKKHKTEFKNNERANMVMMSVGLRNDFDLKNTVLIR
jgi:predicted membrane-bound dolichyl-phosphate-mannose-protein mannosyltransferase